MVLTASTSEAYSLLFRLLADPGDGYLVVSLLPPEPVLEEGARRLVASIAATV